VTTGLINLWSFPFLTVNPKNSHSDTSDARNEFYQWLSNIIRLDFIYTGGQNSLYNVPAGAAGAIKNDGGCRVAGGDRHDAGLKMSKRVLKEYDTVSLKPENLNGRLDFESVFGRKASVHIEIGSGKGTFLLSEARHRPDVNFLGVEWARKYYRYAVDRIGRWGLTNVRIIRTDVASFLREHVPDESISCFHIYFPDPWPKKRHHKRRFICTENMEQMVRCLQHGGFINIATDHQEYFAWIRQVISVQTGRGNLEETAFIRAAGAEAGEVVGTNYERKYIKAARPIFTTAARKP